DVDAVRGVGADRVACPDVEVVDADARGATVEHADSHPAVLVDLRIDHGGGRALDRHAVARVARHRRAVDDAARTVRVSYAVAPGVPQDGVLHDEPRRAVGCDAVAAPGHGDAVQGHAGAGDADHV